MQVTTESLKALGEKVKAERIRQRFSVQAAARAANMARDTWKRVEAGEGVHDTSRSAALELLGLDRNGDPLEPAPQPGMDTGEMMRAVLDRVRDLERENQALRERAARLGRDASA